jgi:alkaline phosphatase
MGPEHVQAARLMAGGEPAMDRLDLAPGLVTTHNIFGEITDSAASRTALATGFKTENGNISMAADDITPLPTVLERAEAIGKATGLVTNLYLQDATPGVWAAHAPSRDGRSIAAQQAVAEVEVLLGSGRYHIFSRHRRQFPRDVSRQNSACSTVK